jgi:hypothetical protein
MKCLYVSNKEIEGCELKAMTIGDFVYNGTRIYCTKLVDPGENQIRMDFILNSYNFTALLANIKHDEIDMFLSWRRRYFPELPTHVNIYDTRDIDESLYRLKTDMDLNIIGYFFKKFIHVLGRITPVTYVAPV